MNQSSEPSPSKVSNGVAQAVRTVRICVAGLVWGGVTFWIIVLVCFPEGSGPEDFRFWGVPALLAFSALCVAAVLTIPARFTKETMIQAADGSWKDEAADLTESSSPPPRSLDELFAQTYTTTRLIAAGLLQAPVFFGAVLYMAGSNRALVWIAAVAQVAAATIFPSRTRVESWIRDRLESLSVERVS